MRSRGVLFFMVAVAAVMYFLNVCTPPTLSDDVRYKCVWGLDEAAPQRPVATLGDVLESQAAHRQVVNGRVVVHTVAQVFMGLVGKDVFNVLNALMFCLLVWLCASFVLIPEGRRRVMPQGGMAVLVGMFLPVVLFAFIFFILVPGFHDAFLWFVGSFNYLWTAVAVMLFLIYFYRRKDASLRAGSILACLPALLAGCTHEGLALPLSIGLGGWLLVRRRRALRSGALPAVVCFMVGTALCVLSPGTLGRAGSNDAPLLSRLVYGCYTMLAFVRVLWVLLLVAAVAWWRRRDVLTAELRRHGVLWFALLPAFGIVIACGQTEGRVCVHAELLASLLLVSLLTRLSPGRALRPVMVCACSLMIAVTVAVAGFALTNRRNYDYQLAQQLDPSVEMIKVRQVPLTGQSAFDALVRRYVMQSVVFGFYSCYQGFDADDVNLRCAAALYGKRRVIYLPEEMAERLLADRLPLWGTLTDSRGEMSAMRIPDGQRVARCGFVLNPEPPESLPFYKRFLSYRGDSYDLPENKFKTLEINGSTYLFFARPLSNIQRRVKDMKVILHHR